MTETTETRSRDRELWLRRGCALIVAAVAAYGSYQHQRAFALYGGADPVSALLWPLSVDGLLLLATVGLLQSDHHASRRVRLAAWLSFLLGIAVSLAANIAAAPTLAWQPILVAGWPPVARLLAAELLTHHPQPRQQTESPPAAPVRGTDPAVPPSEAPPPAKPPRSRSCGNTCNVSGPVDASRPARSWTGLPASTTTDAPSCAAGANKVASPTPIPTAVTDTAWCPIPPRHPTTDHTGLSAWGQSSPGAQPPLIATVTTLLRPPHQGMPHVDPTPDHRRQARPPRPVTTLTVAVPTWYTGNAADDGAHHRSWFLGRFIDPAEGVRSTNDIELKWSLHPAGDHRIDWSPVDPRCTLVLLIHGRFRVDLPDASASLHRQGDYIVWGPGHQHSWQAEEASTVVTVRWPSNPR